MSDTGNDDAEVGGGEEIGGDVDVANRDFEMTETSYQSYCGKMGDSCKGLCFGMILFVVSIVLLVFNEGRAVRRAKDLEEGQEIVVDIDLSEFSKTVNGNNNELIHAVGKLSTNSTLTDDIFGVTTGTAEEVNDIFEVTDTNVSTSENNTTAANVSTSEVVTTTNDFALRLKRSIEMYQWKERSTKREVKTSNGGTRTETTYSYDKVWSSTFINSNSFKNQNTQTQNPRSFPFEPLELKAENILLGNVLEVSTPVIDKFTWYEPIDSVEVKNIPDVQLQQRIEKQSQNKFYYYANPQSINTSTGSEIGDTIISFDVVEPVIITIVALLENGKLSEFQTSRGGELLLIKRGEYTSDEMFQQANEENEQLTWVLRFVGFFLMVVSILLFLQPIATATDIIPFVGDCLGDGLEGCLFPIIAVIIALPISLLVIMIAWLAYRPIIAIPLVIGSGAIIICLCMRVRKSQANKPDKTDDEDNKPSYASGTPYTSSAPQAQAQAQPYYHQSQPTAQIPTNDVPFSQALDLPPPSQQQQHAMPLPSAEPEVVVNPPFVPQIYKP